MPTKAEYQKNKAKYNAKARKWLATNRKRWNEYMRKRAAAEYKENPKRQIAASKRYADKILADPEKREAYRAAKREYYYNNHRHIRKYQREYKRRKAAEKKQQEGNNNAEKTN